MYLDKWINFVIVRNESFIYLIVVKVFEFLIYLYDSGSSYLVINIVRLVLFVVVDLFDSFYIVGEYLLIKRFIKVVF